MKSQTFLEDKSEESSLSHTFLQTSAYIIANLLTIIKNGNDSIRPSPHISHKKTLQSYGFVLTLQTQFCENHNINH